MIEKLKLLEPALIEFLQALISGLLGGAIGLQFGGNLKGSLRGAITYIFFTVLFSLVVFWSSKLFIDEWLVRIVASAFVSSLCYVLFTAVFVAAKMLAKKPIETISRLKGKK